MAVQSYNNTEKEITQAIGQDDAMRKVEKGLMLRSIDTLWIEHLEALDHLRTGIGLRGYGQRDPLIEYKKEAFILFQELLAMIRKQIIYSIYKIGVATKLAPSEMQSAGNLTFKAPVKTGDGSRTAIQAANENRGKTPQQREVENRSSQAPVEDNRTHFAGQKVGRNDPCPCGSGKKFKKCHGK